MQIWKMFQMQISEEPIPQLLSSARLPWKRGIWSVETTRGLVTSETAVVHHPQNVSDVIPFYVESTHTCKHTHGRFEVPSHTTSKITCEGECNVKTSKHPFSQNGF